jgi:feruloyl esterase
MPGLAELLQRLAQGRGPSAAPAAPSRLREVASFGANPGGLRMFAYAPERLAPRPAVVVVLHGCTQTAAGYDDASGWSRLADEDGFVLVFPEQRKENNPRLCFNWFEPGDTARGAGEAASVRAMVEHAIRTHDADRTRVFVTGLSAGGAMAAALLAAYPETFAGGAIIAGLPYGAAHDVPGAFKAMYQGIVRPADEWGGLVRAAAPAPPRYPRVAIWHGSADATVKPVNADELVKQWTNVHGLGAAPFESDLVDGATRRVWRGPDGAALVEEVIVPRLGHGAPLDVTPGAPGRGRAAPFMLDAGVSSTYRIALGFGVAAERPRSERAPSAALPHTQAGAQRQPTPRLDPGPRPGLDVGGIINAALRKAGLLRG